MLSTKSAGFVFANCRATKLSFEQFLIKIRQIFKIKRFVLQLAISHLADLRKLITFYFLHIYLFLFEC